MEISKQEAREHIRAGIVWLNESSRNLKKAIRTKGVAPKPNDQANLKHVQKQLTYLHAMLAISRGRVHPTTPYATNTLKRCAYVLGAKERRDMLAYTRAMIEGSGEHLLGTWWGHFRVNVNNVIGSDRPSLGAIWRALITISDPEAREAAFRTGGVDAILTVPPSSSTWGSSSPSGTMAAAVRDMLKR
jgi:hypothetical protein